MSKDEMLFQLRRLQRYIVEVRLHQTEDCNHNHHCHWPEKLIQAENIAAAIIDEIALQQGERLAQAVNL